MEERGNQLAELALRVWPPLEVDFEDVQKAELEERIAQAKRYNIDTLKVEPDVQLLLDQLRPQVMTLGDDVLELFGPKTITYRIYDFFVEIIPRRWRLDLLLNLDFEACDDPAGIAKDTSDRIFVMNSVESGGVICRIKTEEDIKPALHLVRQAYENLAE
jgi:predicted transport protein